MKIFIDFDDTLFNTKDFSYVYKKIFEKCGVCKDIFKELYYDYPQKKGDKLLKYNFNDHVRRIGEECKMDTGELRNKVAEFIKDTRHYIFKDVWNFLDNFKKEELILVSLGDNEFQKSKIKNSGIEKKFEKVIVTDEMKSNPLRENIDGNEGIYFLDDRMEQIENVKEALPKAVTILVKRKEGRFNDQKNKYCDFQIENLQEALKIIKK